MNRDMYTDGRGEEQDSMGAFMHAGGRGRGQNRGQGSDYFKPKHFPVSPNSTFSPRMRPAREIYRPPVIGGPFNPNAQEFSPLRSSKSVELHRGNLVRQDKMSISSCGPQDNIPAVRYPSSPTLRDRLTMRPGQSPGGGPEVVVGGGKGHVQGQAQMQLRKSRSLQAACVSPVQIHTDFTGSFSPEIELAMNRALDDPNRLPGRTLMELVRVVFQRLVEGKGMAEPAAKFCIAIIEREKNETFLESLLNTCQEWYYQREMLLRGSLDNNNSKWAAFMSFLNEMYVLLKRKQLQLMTKYEGIPPKLVLLSLLGECCMVTLSQQTLNSVNEVECLFIILTQIGRDLEVETPGQMSLLLTCLREAFLGVPAVSGSVKKTLLQLVELQAAGWQLPAQAVMYYYPGANIVR